MKPLVLMISSFLCSQIVFAQTPGRHGCQAATDFTALAEVYALSGESDATSILREIRTVRAQACSGEFDETETVRYPNGKTATSWAGREDATWYWPNGKSITSYALREDATVYYPNGKTASSYFRRLEATFYYPNGKTMTSYAGKQGATIYGIHGSSLVSSAPGFEIDGRLDVSSFLDYVAGLNGSQTHPEPIGCSASQLKLQVERAMEYVRANANQQALETLKVVRNCL